MNTTENQSVNYCIDRHCKTGQDLVNFARDFMDENGRHPDYKDFKVKRSLIEYHFGSLNTLLVIARELASFDELGTLPVIPKSKKVRFCRTCKKKLPRHRWYFCNQGCEDGYKDLEDPDILFKDLVGRPKRVPRRIWKKCAECPEKCKIKIPKDLEEPPYKVVCKVSPEYEELNSELSKGKER